MYEQGFTNAAVLYVTELDEAKYPHMRTNAEAKEHHVQHLCWGTFLDHVGPDSLLAVADGVHRTLASVEAVLQKWIAEDTMVK